MARHDQKGRDTSFVCWECRVDCCNACIDVLRKIYTKRMLCKCKLENHTQRRDEAEPDLAEATDG